jgi:hypothetical protein
MRERFKCGTCTPFARHTKDNHSARLPYCCLFAQGPTIGVTARGLRPSWRKNDRGTCFQH